MGAIDLDQYWPLPPYNRGSAPVSAAPPEASAHIGNAEDAPPPLKGLPTVAPPFAADVLPHRRYAGPVLWSSLGFIAGMLVWHLVGFWSFVTDVVDSRVEPKQPLAAVAALPAKKLAGQLPQTTSGRETAGADPLRCVSLTIDRALGDTRKAACTEASALRDAGFAAKADRVSATPRLQDPGQWSNSTAVEASNIETGTLRADDVDLAIKP